MRPGFAQKLIRAWICLAATLPAFAAGTPTLAADIRVYSSGAPTEVVRGLAARVSDVTGHPISVVAGTVSEIRRRLSAAEKPDIVILPTFVIEQLEKAGTLDIGGRIELARVGIGVAARAGATRLDISTADSLRKVLIDARSIVHSDPLGGGFAGAHVARTIARLGIADVVKPKTSFMFAIGGGLAAVAKGDIEIGLFTTSEILAAKGVTFVGPLPPELQEYINFSGALHAGTASPEAATAFLRSLTDANAREAWTVGGFEPLGP